MPRSAFRGIALDAWNLLFPRRCAICRDSIMPDSISDMCDGCKKSIAVTDATACELCGKIIDGSLVDAGIIRCGYCRTKSPPVEQTVFGMRYEGTARDLIHQFKFNGRQRLAKSIVPMLCAKLHRRVEMEKIDLVIPVPLHIRRLFKRGYNQSYLIAREVSRIFSIPVSADILHRCRDTDQQWSQTRAQRLSNMRGAFMVRNSGRIAGKRVLLVDDIMTTGATMFESARAVKKSGADCVIAGVAARA